jgi:copper homeostasis protein
MEKLEIISETLQDALSAVQGGATQLDLKSHYPCGGLTPSIGTVKTILEHHVEIPIVMMIRPTARSWVVQPGELEAACADIQAGMDLGVRDFMLGFLTPEGKFDAEAVEFIRKQIGDCRLHVHLAWELTADPWEALQTLLDLGFKSLHTGGLSTTGKAIGGHAADAVEVICKIKEIVNDQMEIFLAGGVTLENAGQLIQSTGITDLHCGRGVRTPSAFDGAVDADKVKALRQTQLAASKSYREK